MSEYINCETDELESMADAIIDRLKEYGDPVVNHIGLDDNNIVYKEITTYISIPIGYGGVMPKDEFDEMVNKMLRFYALVTADEIELFRELSRRSSERKAHSNNKTPRLQTGGYVYLLQSPTGAYKIGRTVDPDDRLKTFAVKLPFEVEYIALIPSKQYKQLESELHIMFEDKRLDGEWFELSNEDIDYIKGLA